MKYFCPIRQLLFFSCLIFISATRLLASQDTDSLRLIYKKQQLSNGELIADTNTIAVLNKLAYSYTNIDSDSGLYFANRAYEISLKIDDNNGLIQSLINKSYILQNQNHLKEALDILFNAIDLLDKNDNVKLRAKAYNRLAIIHKKKGEYKEAIKYNIKSLDIIEDEKEMTPVLNSIAIIYSTLENYEKALPYFERALEIEKKQNNYRKTSRIYQNIALVNQYMGKLDQAKEYLGKSLEIEEKTNNPMGLAEIYSMQAYLDEDNEDYEKALENRFKALKIFKELERLSYELYEVNNIGVIYLHQKKYTKAIEQFNRALESATLIEDREMKKEAFYNLSLSYREMKNYKESLFYLEKFNSLKDSIFNLTTSQQIAELEEKYESEKKEKEIFQLQTENERQQNDIIRKENFSKIVIVVSTLLVLVIILLFRNYREKMRRKLVESKHQRTIEQQKTLEILKNQEIEMINAIMEVQEKERSRIAEEIHDHLGNNLATIKLFFDTLQPQMKALDHAHQNQYNKAVKLLEKTCTDVRKIATDVASNILTKFGLVAAIKEMANLIADAGDMEIKVISYGLDRRLENSIELALFRIIQELITNILKHSNASEASIQITKHEHSLNIIVEDNGKGFHTKQVEAGMGLKNINSRLEKIKGEIVVDSGKGAGTTVTIDLEI